MNNEVMEWAQTILIAILLLAHNKVRNDLNDANALIHVLVKRSNQR